MEIDWGKWRRRAGKAFTRRPWPPVRIVSSIEPACTGHVSPVCPCFPQVICAAQRDLFRGLGRSTTFSRTTTTTSRGDSGMHNPGPNRPPTHMPCLPPPKLPSPKPSYITCLAPRLLDRCFSPKLFAILSSSLIEQRCRDLFAVHVPGAA